MRKNDSIDWKVIMSHLKGCATDEEEKLFQAWLKSDPSHGKYIESARQAWQDEIQPIHENHEAGFRELMTLLQRPQVSRHKLIRRISYTAAACIVAGIFACHYLWHTRINQTFPTETLQLSDFISPGTSKATLVLDNGQEISLGDNLLEMNIDGVELKDDSTNNLQYHTSQKEETTQYNRLVVPRGGEYCVTLTDGTMIWLNSESELRYPTSFAGDIRRVELKGEAYFKVARNESQPFIVDAGDCHVEVLGTEFNLSAYPDDHNKVTTLLRGKVKVGTDRFAQPDTLLPDMQFIYNKVYQTKQIHQVNAAMYGSWRHGHFEFDHTSFEQFLKTVSRWYDFQYQVRDSSLLNYHFTGAFDKSDHINDLFKILKSSKIPITISYQDNRVIFDRKYN